MSYLVAIGSPTFWIFCWKDSRKRNTFILWKKFSGPWIIWLTFLDCRVAICHREYLKKSANKFHVGFMRPRPRGRWRARHQDPIIYYLFAIFNPKLLPNVNLEIRTRPITEIMNGKILAFLSCSQVESWPPISRFHYLYTCAWCVETVHWLGACISQFEGYIFRHLQLSQSLRFWMVSSYLNWLVYSLPTKMVLLSLSANFHFMCWDCAMVGGIDLPFHQRLSHSALRSPAEGLFNITGGGNSSKNRSYGHNPHSSASDRFCWPLWVHDRIQLY